MHCLHFYNSRLRTLSIRKHQKAEMVNQLNYLDYTYNMYSRTVLELKMELSERAPNRTRVQAAYTRVESTPLERELQHRAGFEGASPQCRALASRPSWREAEPALELALVRAAPTRTTSVSVRAGRARICAARGRGRRGARVESARRRARARSAR